MVKRIKRAVDRMVGRCIGDFLGMSGHEDATKHGLRMMSVEQLDELRDACERVQEWVKEVHFEKTIKKEESKNA